MTKIIIGIDPDSKAHGVATYHDGRLVVLDSMPLVDLIWVFEEAKANNEPIDAIHIENVCGNNAAFSKSFVKNAAAKSAISRTLGMCQQSQIEVERMAEHYGIKVVKHKISKKWKKEKKEFELVTGWGLRSNEDTRSAAYFGWLGCT